MFSLSYYSMRNNFGYSGYCLFTTGPGHVARQQHSVLHSPAADLLVGWQLP
jgi:hypothetical protein